MSTTEKVLKLGGRAHVLTDNAASRVLSVTISSLLGMALHEHNREFVERVVELLSENIATVEASRESDRDREFVASILGRDLAVIESAKK